jgi:RNA polymerase sigma-70 factor (ECF subfamily)
MTRPVEREESQARARALEGLARRFVAPLTRYFRRRSISEEDVADLVQDVLLRLAQLQNMNDIEKPENYIFKTAANLLRERARHRASRHADAHLAFDPEIHTGSDFAADRIYAGREAVRALEEAIRRLPEMTRDIFVLRVLEGLRTADVARMTGMSTRNVELHQARALAHLAKALRAHRDG